MTSFVHVTVTTNHSMTQHRDDIDPEIKKIVGTWLKKVRKGVPQFFFDDPYALRLISEPEHRQYAIFSISRYEKPTNSFVDILMFSVCRSADFAQMAWEAVGGEGEHPTVPFCAAELLESNIKEKDLSFMEILGGFEAVLAWEWFEQS